MKKWIAILGIIALAAGGIPLLVKKLRADPFPSLREFEVLYQARLTEIHPEIQTLKVWIPLGSTRDGQKILSRTIQAPGPYRITQDPVFGNEMIYFEAKGPFQEPLEFQIDYKAQVEKNAFSVSSEEEPHPLHLKPSHLAVVNDEVRKRTRAAIDGLDSSREKRARAIYDYVIAHMVYEKETPGWGRGDTLRACLLGRGNCTDFHSLFISMAQSVEIPARFKIGFTIPEEKEGKIPGYHCWAEFFEEGKGWRPVDASEAWKHPEWKQAYFGNFDTNKFLISVGRDIELVPRQAGEPVNIFFYPYAEGDGKELSGIETSFQFRTSKI